MVKTEKLHSCDSAVANNSRRDIRYNRTIVTAILLLFISYINKKQQ